MSGVLDQLRTATATQQLRRQVARFRSPVAIGAIVVAVGMLLGRVSGLMREMSLASVYGVSRSADLAVFAMTLPDLLTNLLIGGAIGAVLIPHYHRTVKEFGEPAGRILLGRVFIVMAVAGSLIAGLMLSTLGLWIPLLGPGFSGNDLSNARQLAAIAMLAFPLSAMSAVVTAGLQISNRITAAVAGTLVVNVTVITVLLLCVREREQVTWAAVAIVLGCLARLVMGALMCDAIDWQRLFAKSTERLITAAIFVSYLRALAGIGFVVCFPVVARAVATGVPGDSATLNYALKLVEVPLGILSAIIGLVLLPRLSSDWQNGRTTESRSLLIKTIAVGCGCVSVFALVFPHITPGLVPLLFGGGGMDISGQSTITDLSNVLIWSAPPAVMATLLTAYCHAKQDTWSPLIAGGISLLLFFPLGNMMHRSDGLSGLAQAIPITFGLLAILLAITPSAILRIQTFIHYMRVNAIPI